MQSPCQLGMKRIYCCGKESVMSLIRRLCILILLSGSLIASPVSASTEQEAAAQLRALLKAHPEIVLDVLNEHGEKLLEILQSASENRRRGNLFKQWESDLAVPKNVATQGRPFGGAENAPVTLVAFSDFLCSYCHQAAVTIGNLMKRYPGKVRMVLKLTPQTESGRIAARWFLAAYGMDKVKAWKLYAYTFDRQKEVEGNATETLRSIAAEVGFDVKALEAEMFKRTGEFNTMMQVDAADARALGFVGTPYFLVNDLVIRGALPLESFSDAVELALKHNNIKK